MSVSPVGRAIPANLAELVGGTPMVRLTRVAPDCGAELVAKLEAYNPAGSVKDRIGVAMIDAAEAEGRIEPGRTTIVEATSGNTGIALAFVCAARGYELVLSMPQGMSREREGLLRLYGADVRITESMGGMNEAVEAARAYRGRACGDAFIPDQFSNPANPEIHRRTTAEEIWRDMDGKVDVARGRRGHRRHDHRRRAEAQGAQPGELLVVAVEPKSLGGALRRAARAAQDPGDRRRLHAASARPATWSTRSSRSTTRTPSRRRARARGPRACWQACPAARRCGAAIQVGSRPEMRGKRMAVVLPDSGERYVSTPFFAPQ